jgi:GNAT superfamily N-acetyltransferase
MTLRWTKEDVPRWDADKQRLFDETALASVGLDRPERGASLADEWWRVTDDDDVVVGYGWLDSLWGDAQITFLVDPARRGQGIGEYILDRLEQEAGARGLNYIYNVVPATHPEPNWMTHWLTLRGFVAGTGDLRRQVRTPSTPSTSSTPNRSSTSS